MPLSCNLVDEMYPLYLNVVYRAKEFRTEPVPKSFFIASCDLKDIQTFATTIRDQQGKLLACIINFENNNILVPYYIGRDYSANKEYNLYYNILWETISTGVARKKKVIDLGLTTYDIKKWLGAEIQPIKMFVRFKSNGVNKVLKYSLPMFLEVPPIQ
ncbi:hypothetical protein MAMMFC1_02138 [Methylomusa anaerophila]|uniref:Uncharacterized protein n=1 Tax=Methylomusa anaerophila TaxID=1930071 RepID=A0A348AK56_9FIRM|nr:hypothetical protein MAMMFC1_02138 [Methylomusa anaerophila]